MAGPIHIVRRLASRVLLDRDFMPICSSEPNDHGDAAPGAHASLPIVPSTAALWTLLGLLISVVLVLLGLWQRHRRARRLLEGGRCNLPTVIWRPRFVNYAPDQDDNHDDDDDDEPRGKPQQKMASSSITNMLPRMERLGGPYGMYGTIYGLSTRVVHVGHPVPAKTILSGLGGGTGAGSSATGSIRQSSSSTRVNQKRRSTFISSSGATKAPAYNHFKNFSGDGVFTADGDEWKAKRASVIHCLLRGCTGDKSDGIRRLEREANHAVDGFIGNIERERKLRGGQQCDQMEDEEADVCLNIVPILQKSTIGLIYRFITHHDIDLCRAGIEENGIEHDEASESVSLAATTPKSSSTSLCSLSEEESPKAVGKGKDSDECHTKSSIEMKGSHTDISCTPMRLLGSYLKSVTHIRMIILAQSRSFWFLVPRWIYRVFSTMYRAEEKTMGPIRDFARAACLNAQPGSPLASLQSRPSHGPGNDSRSSRNPTDVSKAMLDEAITLLFAGQDTSAATLSWTLHLLSLHPEVQENLAKEVAGSLEEQRSSEDHGGAQFFTKQFISKLPYLDAVIKESMRLYPVAPFVVRRLPQDVAIPAENTSGAAPTILPEGSLACVWIYALHRNPRLWHRPDDFVPERWIDPKLKDLDEGQQSGAFMPFANGPRNCVGQPLAHVILRTMLARIVDQYRVVDKRLGHDGGVAMASVLDLRKDMQAGFTVLPSGGVRLSLQRR